MTGTWANKHKKSISFLFFFVCNISLHELMMEMKMRALLVCLIAACFVAAAHGFVRGDLVKTSTRARYGAVISRDSAPI
jgi:hypothetical protein